MKKWARFPLPAYDNLELLISMIVTGPEYLMLDLRPL